MASLSLLQEYDSSEDENKEEENPSKKRKLPQPILPDFVAPRSISREPVKAFQNDERVRSFPHEPGNWATYVAIPVDPPPEIDSFVDNLIATFSPLSLKEVDDWHISLTRVLVLRYHWIDGFIRSMRDVLTNYRIFTLTLQGLSVYLNDEKTRTFVAMRVKYGGEFLNELVDQFDKCLTDYGLPTFYINRSFHMSVLWGLGDLKEDIDKVLSSLADASLTNFVIPVRVTSCICKTGKKVYNLPIV